jgi:hypothetical protein
MLQDNVTPSLATTLIGKQDCGARQSFAIAVSPNRTRTHGLIRLPVFRLSARRTQLALPLPGGSLALDDLSLAGYGRLFGPARHRAPNPATDCLVPKQEWLGWLRSSPSYAQMHHS